MHGSLHSINEATDSPAKFKLLSVAESLNHVSRCEKVSVMKPLMGHGGNDWPFNLTR